MKIALLFISLNKPYWPYLKDVVKDCDEYFLRNRGLNCQVDYFAWTDMPQEELPSINVIPTDPVPWPHPTLMRYHLFLQEEERLKDYDYIFYLDADMKIVAPIGKEILCEGLMMAEHPMYSLARKYIPPYEPNMDSAAFIPRLGVVLNDEKGRWFKPLYAAGGFQGGQSTPFIEAMKEMKKTVDADLVKNYIAIWNDESHWNKYLYKYFMIDKKPMTVLSPSYVYPDSLIKEYYEPTWGCSYTPKIMTLTKPFTLQKLPDQLTKELFGKTPPKAFPFRCPTCQDVLVSEAKIHRIIECKGKGQPHEVEADKT